MLTPSNKEIKTPALNLGRALRNVMGYSRTGKQEAMFICIPAATQQIHIHENKGDLPYIPS
jgi:hypothetical protein